MEREEAAQQTISLQEMLKESTSKVLAKAQGKQ